MVESDLVDIANLNRGGLAWSLLYLKLGRAGDYEFPIFDYSGEGTLARGFDGHLPVYVHKPMALLRFYADLHIANADVSHFQRLIPGGQGVELEAVCGGLQATQVPDDMVNVEGTPALEWQAYVLACD